MYGYEDARRAKRDEARERIARRAFERQHRIDLIERPGGLAAADTPERIDMRLARLRQHHGDEQGVNGGLGPIVPPFVPGTGGFDTGIDAGAVTVGVVLERIINRPDFMDVRFLEAGVAAVRAVCRVVIRERGAVVGHGTGSLITPRLMLTNHHVLPTAEIAGGSVVEFDFQDGIDGRPRRVREFELDPAACYLADEVRDFAIVAVRAEESVLAEFGFNRLIAEEGKAIAGEYVTIVQHPGGRKKQIVLRENRIVDVLDTFLHYQADTEPGSSGSPVFNDEWEVVALHHASVPAPDHEELGGFLNEGVRISRIAQFVRARSMTGTAGRLLAQIGRPERAVIRRRLADGAAASSTATVPRAVDERPAAVSSAAVLAPAAGTATFTIPIEVTIRLGDGVGAAGGTVSVGGSGERIAIDPDYAGRRGYDPDFLGADHRVPLPELPDELLALAARDSTRSGADGHVLRYHHFSLAMNRERRIAFYTAVNIDGATSQPIRREGDRWFRDPRLAADEQTDEELYEKNALDRGHLVRRLDPAWGPSRADALSANDDTFHFTNCTPQHRDFNREQTTWAGLEDYILDHADNRDLRISVLSGPVFGAGDDEYRGVRLPRQYWKLVAMVLSDGRLSATAYLLSQESLLDGLEVVPEEFSYGAYRTFQVPVVHVEAMTGLSFGPLAAADPIGGEEAAVRRRIDALDEVVLAPPLPPPAPIRRGRRRANR